MAQRRQSLSSDDGQDADDHDENAPLPAGQAHQRGSVVGAVGLATGCIAREESEDGRASRLFALRRSRAPKVASWDDLVQVRDSLRADISNGLLEVRLEVSTALDRVVCDLKDFKAATERNQEAAAADLHRTAVEANCFAEGCSARLQQDIQVAATNLEARIAEGLQATELALQASMMREVARDEAVEQHIARLAARLAAVDSVRWTTMAAHVNKQVDCLRTETSALAEDYAAFRDGMSAISDEGFSSLRQQQADLDKVREAKVNDLFADLRETIERVRADFEGYRDTSSATMSESLARADRSIVDIREETHQRLSWLDEQAGRIRELVKEVENIPTRRVEWLVRDAAARTAELLRIRSRGPAFNRVSHGDAGLLSPVFETGGACGLRLEIRRAERPPQPAVPEEGAAIAPGGGGGGDADLLLWSPNPLHIVCRLSIGEACVQVEHTFDGRQPCVAARLATLREQINPQDDTLRVCLEVLEVVREVELDRRAARSSSDALGEIREEDKHGDRVSLYRYLNHRILDLVESKVDLLRSRMVRRIEWRLDGASSLRKAFPEGECLCSTTFAAAGMEGLQLVFYPSGYTGAKEGYCSFFLYCPAGTALRCWLAIGKQRREARLFFERSGFYGRTNFCRFDSCTAPGGEDAITLVLEIDEAQQSVSQELAHEAPAVEVSPPPSAPAGLVSLDSSNHVMTEKVQVGSRLTFKRAPGRQALEDVRQLPCIWTPRPQANLAESLQGFHTMNDIRARKPAGNTSHRGPRPVSAATMDRYVMYAA